MRLILQWDEKKREAKVRGDSVDTVARELGSDEALAFLAGCQQIITRIQQHSLESRAKVDEIIIRRSPLGREGRPFV